MKKVLLVLIAIGASFATFAQATQIDQFFQKYEGKPGFTSVNVSEKLFSLVASAASEDVEPQSVVDGLKGIKVLVYENEEGNTKSGEYYREISSTLSLNSYEELMTVNSELDKVRILGKMESDKVINELLILCDADGEFVLVSLFGTIDVEKISKLSKLQDINIEGLDELENLDDKK